MNCRKLGAQYEEKAAEYLEGQGYTILHRNYRCRMGELDLVALDGEVVVFVEVKYRSNGRQGSSLAAVDRRKQQILGKMAAIYLQRECHSVEVPCRFDVVGIDGNAVCHHKDAFWLESMYG